MKKKLIVPLALALAMLLCTPAMAATVCKIGSKGYSSLQKAIDKVKDGQTITMTKAVNTEKTVDTSSSKARKFTIDFKNKKYTFTHPENIAFGVFPNRDRNGDIDVTFKKNTNFVFKGSTGSMIVIGGMFAPKAKLTIKSGKFTDTPIIIPLNAVLNISGGTFQEASFRLGVHGVTGGTLNITGGTFVNLHVKDPGNVTIKSGLFRGSAQGIAATFERETVVKIKGGTFDGNMVFRGKAILSGGKSTGAVVADEGGNVTIKYFKVDQTGQTVKGPLGNTCLVAWPGKMTVKGGSFISPDGYGYAKGLDGKIFFKTEKSYKKLFKVKTLKLKVP